EDSSRSSSAIDLLDLAPAVLTLRRTRKQRNHRWIANLRASRRPRSFRARPPQHEAAFIATKIRPHPEERPAGARLEGRTLVMQAKIMHPQLLSPTPADWPTTPRSSLSPWHAPGRYRLGARPPR